MCGRFTLTLPFEDIQREFQTALSPMLEWKPKDQIFPSEKVPAVAESEGKRVLRLMRWGLIPAWSKEFPKTALINARAETLLEKPSFKHAFATRRCLIPAQSFIEWKAEGRKKIPHQINLKENSLFALAGIWERWKPLGGSPIDSLSIVTTHPNSLLEPIHSRMPVILAPDDYTRWLCAATPMAEITPLLRPYEAQLMSAQPMSVSPVLSPTSNSPSRHTASKKEPDQLSLLGLDCKFANQRKLR